MLCEHCQMSSLDPVLPIGGAGFLLYNEGNARLKEEERVTSTAFPYASFAMKKIMDPIPDLK